MPPAKRASGMIPPTAATSPTITLGPCRKSRTEESRRPLSWRPLRRK